MRCAWYTLKISVHELLQINLPRSDKHITANHTSAEKALQVTFFHPCWGGVQFASCGGPEQLAPKRDAETIRFLWGGRGGAAQLTPPNGRPKQFASCGGPNRLTPKRDAETIRLLWRAESTHSPEGRPKQFALSGVPDQSAPGFKGRPKQFASCDNLVHTCKHICVPARIHPYVHPTHMRACNYLKIFVLRICELTHSGYIFTIM